GASRHGRRMVITSCSFHDASCGGGRGRSWAGARPHFSVIRWAASFQRDVVLAQDRRGGELERGDRLAEVCFDAPLLAARRDHGALPLLDQEQRRGSGAKLALLA